MLGYNARQVVDYTDHVWVELALPTAEAAKGKPSSGTQLFFDLKKNNVPGLLN
jgi:hypothetical protein